MVRTHRVTLNKPLKGAVWTEALGPSQGLLSCSNCVLPPGMRANENKKGGEATETTSPHPPCHLVGPETISIFSYYVYTGGRTHIACSGLPQSCWNGLYFPGILRTTPNPCTHRAEDLPSPGV
ncbi:RIKEN cDNA 4933434M16 [Mus musculus]|jgi:hypothetical protein|uniref:Uncharacterized protein n=1 Tax=Mus musculus TaxID=10090 RepID=Q9D3U1_MOUSE|nr:RIKEN cDNA 4933434M16 [Mus musculus]BAB30575.1 unnamed protein product [Mus musculus]